MCKFVTVIPKMWLFAEFSERLYDRTALNSFAFLLLWHLHLFPYTLCRLIFLQTSVEKFIKSVTRNSCWPTPLARQFNLTGQSQKLSVASVEISACTVCSFHDYHSSSNFSLIQTCQLMFQVDLLSVIIKRRLGKFKTTYDDVVC